LLYFREKIFGIDVSFSDIVYMKETLSPTQNWITVLSKILNFYHKPLYQPAGKKYFLCGGNLENHPLAFPLPCCYCLPVQKNCK